jgi:hypothetical protein
MMHEPLQSRPQDEGAKSCTCLKIEPQSDSNLKDIHPNIYIPSSLLDYPDHIVKYGGGGSGVTGKKRRNVLYCIRCSRLYLFINYKLIDL